VAIGGFSLASAAQFKLYQQETANVKILYYDPAHEYVVRYLMQCFENTLQFDRKVFHYKPEEQITIMLEDFGDFGHGGAGTVPRDLVSIGLEPLSYTFETVGTNERIAWIIDHEMVHISMADEATGPDLFFRHLFGGKVMPNPDDPISMFYSSLTSPRHYSPRWYHEGIAAFMETWETGGMGRALGGYDEMVFRTMVRDDAHIYDVVGLESEGTSVDFQIGANSYLYGTRFMTHVAYKYGPEKLMQWVSRDPGTKRYFSSQFQNVFGVGLREEWQQWIRDEHQWQNSNLKRIRQYPVTELKRISPQTLGSVSRSYYDPAAGVIYAAVRYAGQMAHIAAIHTDTGKVDHLKDLKGVALYYVTSMSYDPKGHRIFYTSDNKDWRDLNVLDLTTNRSRRLMTNNRTGDLVYCAADGAIWGMRHNNGQSSIVRLPDPFNTIEVLHTFPFGSDLFDIDISPDGKYLTGGLTNMSGQQKLVRFELAKLKEKDATFDVLHDFDYATPGNFVYSPDGRYMYGSSYYTGASNLFRYDFQNAKMDVVSNSETGLFRPLPMPDGRVIAYEYTSKGFSPSFVDAKPLTDVSAVDYLGQATVEKWPALRQWKLASPSSINVDKVLTNTGYYRSFSSMRLISAYPIVQGYKDTAAGGIRVELADRLRVSRMNFTSTYSPDPSLPLKERFHFGLESYYWNFKLTAYYNYADFYDLFGPTKLSRRGWGSKLEHRQSLIFDMPRTLDLKWSVAGYGGFDALPDYQNVAAVEHRVFTAKTGLEYSYLDSSLGSVDDEKGTLWTTYSKFNFAGTRGFPQFYATYDKGGLLPIGHSSIWFRGAAGKAFGDPNDPFANFYFGGFGNNWIDHQEISRYRLFYSFPGVGLDAIGASSFGKGLVEWNLPPVRFRRFGATAVYCNWMRLSLFSSGLLTNLGNSLTRSEYGNIGAQLDFRIVLFTYLNSTFSTGYAAATDQHGHISTEYMISLKLL
jgi:hypothetical protein